MKPTASDVVRTLQQYLEDAEAFYRAGDYGGAFARAEKASFVLSTLAADPVEKPSKAELDELRFRLTSNLQRYRAALDAWQEENRQRHVKYLERELGYLPAGFASTRASDESPPARNAGRRSRRWLLRRGGGLRRYAVP